MTTPVNQGDIIAGKYRVDRVLGIGGMGVVVAAHHLELGQPVAIKFLRPETLGNAEAVARFAREARATVKIKSEHVARVSHVGTLETGALYMVMEYLEGTDLSGWLAERGPLPVEQAVEFVLQAGEAIAEAHSLGIVHRDLKPANLFVLARPDGHFSIKVLDFGISKMTSTTESASALSMTKTYKRMGSPSYMSPEQIQSSKYVDARCDVWALGVILYELITGVAPFGGGQVTELMYRIMSAGPQPLRVYRTDAPNGLQAVIFHCLEKDRARRFGSVAELAIALAPFASLGALGSVARISGMANGSRGADSSDRPPSSEWQAKAKPEGETLPPWHTFTTRKRRGPWLALGGVGVVAIVAAGIAAIRLTNRGAIIAPEVTPVAALRAVAAPASSVEPPSNAPSSLPVASLPSGTPKLQPRARPIARAAASQAPEVSSSAEPASDPWRDSRY